jgi:hypothetical protein
VLAASDALVHSSAGLTVLEAIIRGCPVISYGFGYGHVRASNAALVRFGLAQVARTEREIAPALSRALLTRPEPDGSFARRPSTASLILADERRARQVPVWRLRTARAITGTAVTVAIAAWTLTTGASYSLVSHFVHMKPVTTVSTARPEVGVLIDSPVGELPKVASALSARGVHVTFTIDRVSGPVVASAASYGDGIVPRLPKGGLVRWLQTRAQIHRLIHELGFQHHFLYASSGPCIGQWLFAHGAGGRLIAGAVKVDDRGDTLGRLHAGEVIELSIADGPQLATVARRLALYLRSERLTAVPVSRLMHDAGVRV